MCKRLNRSPCWMASWLTYTDMKFDYSTEMEADDIYSYNSKYGLPCQRLLERYYNYY